MLIHMKCLYKYEIQSILQVKDSKYFKLYFLLRKSSGNKILCKELVKNCCRGNDWSNTHPYHVHFIFFFIFYNIFSRMPFSQSLLEQAQLFFLL